MEPLTANNPFLAPGWSMSLRRLISDTNSGYDKQTWSGHLAVFFETVGVDVKDEILCTAGARELGHSILDIPLHDGALIRLGELYDAVTDELLGEFRDDEIVFKLKQWIESVVTPNRSIVNRFLTTAGPRLTDDYEISWLVRYEVAACILASRLRSAVVNRKIRPSRRLTLALLAKHDLDKKKARQEWKLLAEHEMLRLSALDDDRLREIYRDVVNSE